MAWRSTRQTLVSPGVTNPPSDPTGSNTPPWPDPDPRGGGAYPQPYPAQPYPPQPHPAQPHPAQPYPPQPYPGQGYPPQPYPGQGYPAQPYPAQGYPAQFPPPYPAPQAKRPMNGLAVAALVLSVLGAVVIAPILAIVSLRKIKRTGENGRGFAIAALAVTGVWALIAVLALVVDTTGTPSPTRDVSGAVTGSGNVVAEEVRGGDCLKSVDDPSGSSEVGALDVVPCTEPHAAEVIGSFFLGGGSYPGESKITDEAEQRCGDMVPTAVTESDLPDLSIVYFYPQVANWAGGDHTVQCVVVSEGDPLTAPLPR